MRRLANLLFCLTGFIAFPNAGHAYQVAVDFSVLPSAQGWLYTSSGIDETSVFSIIGGNTLRQDTIGIGPGHGANYQLMNQLVAGQQITLSFTAKLISEEGDPTDYGALSAGVGLDNFAYAIALRPGEIRDLDNNLISKSVDTSVFHTYVLSINPGFGYTVSVDGTLIAARDASVQFPLNYIYFGDGSNLNARGEFTALTVSQVPVPPAFFMFALGLGSLGALRRHSPDNTNRILGT